MIYFYYYYYIELLLIGELVLPVVFVVVSEIYSYPDY